jgi:hypothetical protein
VVIGRKNLWKYNILEENDHAYHPGKLLIMHKITNMHTSYKKLSWDEKL